MGVYTSIIPHSYETVQKYYIYLHTLSSGPCKALFKALCLAINEALGILLRAIGGRFTRTCYHGINNVSEALGGANRPLVGAVVSAPWGVLDVMCWVHTNHVRSSCCRSALRSCGQGQRVDRPAHPCRCCCYHHSTTGISLAYPGCQRTPSC